jgi:hypothetical protein
MEKAQKLFGRPSEEKIISLLKNSYLLIDTFQSGVFIISLKP